MSATRNERVADLYLTDRTSEGNPTYEGQIRRVSNDIKAYIDGAVVSLISGTGLTEAAHRALDQLVHRIAETNYTEVVRASGRVQDIIVWTDSGKTQKIRETNLTRTGGQISQIVEKQYDGTGTLVETLTGTVSRAGGQVDTIDWALT